MNINDLPSDVLHTIFRYVVRDAHPPRISPLPIEENPTKPLEQLLLFLQDGWDTEGGLEFEYPTTECLAAVCPYWCQAMSALSEFWKSFIIWIGRDATSISRVREYFAWSGTHTLDVFISRRYDPSVCDPSESAHMQAILEILTPHISRIRVLHVNCLHSSSLPHPRVNLHGQANVLLWLELDSIIDDLVVDNGATAPLRELHTPGLQRLSINAAHFRESYVHAISPPLLPVLREITIHDYCALHEVAFPVIDLIGWLNNRETQLLQITLDNLHLDYSYDGPPTSTRPYETYINFISMPGNVIAEYARLLDYPYPEFMSFTACTVPTGVYAERGFMSAFHCLLNLVTDEATLLYYLSQNVGLASCKDLSIVNCPALTPAVLTVLASPAPPHEDGRRNYWPCTGVKNLCIEDCPEVHSTDVRTLAQARYDVHAAAGFVHEVFDMAWTVTALEELTVTGCGQLAPEDREWFDEHLAAVTWDEWDGGHGVWREYN